MNLAKSKHEARRLVRLCLRACGAYKTAHLALAGAIVEIHAAAAIFLDDTGQDAAHEMTGELVRRYAALVRIGP